MPPPAGTRHDGAVTEGTTRRPPPRAGRFATRRRAPRRSDGGTTLVEFALTVPAAFALLFGSILVGIIVFDQVQLDNVVRDGARAAAICGGASRTSDTTLPNGASCTTSHLQSYMSGRLQAVPVGVSINVTVLLTGGATSTDLDQCSASRLVEVDASYPQTLYVPLIGKLLSSNNTRTISATGEAICSQ